MTKDEIISYLLDELIAWEGGPDNVILNLIYNGATPEFMDEYFALSAKEYAELKAKGIETFEV